MISGFTVVSLTSISSAVFGLETTAETRAMITEVLSELLVHCLHERQLTLPLHVMCVGDNGSVEVTRIEGSPDGTVQAESVCDRCDRGAIGMPIVVAVVDSFGNGLTTILQ